MTSSTSGEQTCSSILNERVRTARPAKLRPGAAANVVQPVDAERLAYSSRPIAEPDLESNLVLKLHSPDVVDQTEKLLLELDQFWGGYDEPNHDASHSVDGAEIADEAGVDEYYDEEPTYTVSLFEAIDVSPASDIQEFEPTSYEQSQLLDRLNEIGSSYKTATEMAKLIESELQDNDKSVDYRLGSLLVELGLITSDLLESCIRFSMEYSVSLGRVLIMSGWVTGKQLQWTIQLQALLREGLISPSAATQVADLMGCAGMTIQRALNCAGYPGILTSQESCANRMGDLLTDAGIVSADDFNVALQRSQLLGMQVGRCLVMAGLVAEPLLETVFNAQRFLRQNKISREDAILAIKSAAHRQSELRKRAAAPIYSGVPLKTVRIGELLSLAGIVSEAHIEHAIEFGLRCNLAVGQVLIDLEIISKRTLDSALTLQEMVSQGSIDTIDAVYALIDVHHHGLDLEQALNRNRKMLSARKSLSFEQFLASVEVVSLEQIEQSIEDARRSPLFVSKALVLSGALSDETVQVALLCHFYVLENLLSADQSLLLFNLCHRTGISVEDGLKELGLSLRNLANAAEEAAEASMF